MSQAILVNSVRTDSIPQYMICEYNITDNIGADSTSTELIEIDLPSGSLEDYSYRNLPNITTNGYSYAIKLIGISISCNSTDYSINFLNKNDISQLNTIYDVVSYDNINILMNDFSFGDNFIIRNRDDILTNKLYLYISNNDSVETGDVKLELTYITIQNREFS